MDEKLSDIAAGIASQEKPSNEKNLWMLTRECEMLQKQSADARQRIGRLESQVSRFTSMFEMIFQQEVSQRMNGDFLSRQSCDYDTAKRY